MRSPGEGADVVLSPAGVTAWFLTGIEDVELAKARPPHSPGAAQPSDPGPYDQERHLSALVGLAVAPGVSAQQVPQAGVLPVNFGSEGALGA